MQFCKKIFTTSFVRTRIRYYKSHNLYQVLRVTHPIPQKIKGSYNEVIITIYVVVYTGKVSFVAFSIVTGTAHSDGTKLSQHSFIV